MAFKDLIELDDEGEIFPALVLLQTADLLEQNQSRSSDTLVAVKLLEAQIVYLEILLAIIIVRYNMTVEASIDTSSLNVLREPQIRKRFIEVCRQRDIKVIVSGHVLDEIFSGDFSDEVKDRGLALYEIWSSIGDLRFSVSRSTYRIIQEELEHEINATPVMSRLQRSRFLLFLKNLQQPSSELVHNAMMACNEVREDKNSAHSLDRNMRSRVDSEDLLNSAEKRAEIEKEFQNFSGPPDDIYWFFEALLNTEKMMAKHLLRPLSQIRMQPRYKVTNIVLSLSWLTMYGGVLTGRSALSEVQLFRVKANNWYDNLIVGAAAYSGYLIVDDAEAKKKAAFLVEKRIANFIPIAVNEFICKDSAVLDFRPEKEFTCR